MINLFSKYQQPSSTNTSSNNNKSSTSAAGTSQSRTLRLSANSASHQPNSNQDPLIVHPQQQHLNPDEIRTQPAIDNNAIFQNGERGHEENKHYSAGLIFSAVINFKKITTNGRFLIIFILFDFRMTCWSF